MSEPPSVHHKNYHLNEYVYADGQMVAQLRMLANELDTFFIHHDYLGNQRICTNIGGSPQSRTYYDAWGQVRWQAGDKVNDYRWIGEKFDDAVWEDHYYLNNRYYNPSIGRFLTPDPLPSDLNPYSYANNNPVMSSDPSGLSGYIGPGGHGGGRREGSWYGSDPTRPRNFGNIGMHFGDYDLSTMYSGSSQPMRGATRRGANGQVK